MPREIHRLVEEDERAIYVPFGEALEKRSGEGCAWVGPEKLGNVGSDSCILPFNFGQYREYQIPGDPKMCLKMGYTLPVTILMGNEILGQPISDKCIGTILHVR